MQQRNRVSWYWGLVRLHDTKYVPDSEVLYLHPLSVIGGPAFKSFYPMAVSGGRWLTFSGHREQLPVGGPRVHLTNSKAGLMRSGISRG